MISVELNWGQLPSSCSQIDYGQLWWCYLAVNFVLLSSGLWYRLYSDGLFLLTLFLANPCYRLDDTAEEVEEVHSCSKNNYSHQGSAAVVVISIGSHSAQSDRDVEIDWYHAFIKECYPVRWSMKHRAPFHDEALHYHRLDKVYSDLDSGIACEANKGNGQDALS